MARLVDDSQARIRETIVTHMPKEAEITRIEFEGPRLAIYVKNVGLLLEQSYVVTEIVNLLHKRVVIRSDPSIRLTENESERLIKGIIPAEAGWSGWLGRYQAALARAAVSIQRADLKERHREPQAR